MLLHHISGDVHARHYSNSTRALIPAVEAIWGNKLIDKVAENVLSALQNPEEALFESAPRGD